MKGYHVPRKAGWDTHGLPVELEVENSLALTSKAQIEEYGVARFNDHCRQSAFNILRMGSYDRAPWLLVRYGASLYNLRQ